MALVDLEFDLYVASHRYPFCSPPNLSMGLTYKIQVSLESIGFKKKLYFTYDQSHEIEIWTSEQVLACLI